MTPPKKSIALTKVTDHITLLLAGAEHWNAFRHSHPDFRPDLRCADLRRLNLSRYNLRDAKLCCCDLSEANLSDVDLTGADLRSATMEGATICDTDLTDVNYQALASIAGAKITPVGVTRDLQQDFVNWALEYGASKMGV